MSITSMPRAALARATVLRYQELEAHGLLSYRQKLALARHRALPGAVAQEERQEQEVRRSLRRQINVLAGKLAKAAGWVYASDHDFRGPTARERNWLGLAEIAYEHFSGSPPEYEDEDNDEPALGEAVP